MTHELLWSVERRVVKQYIGSFFDLFTELLEAFHNNRCIYFPFCNVRIQVVVPIQKTSDVETTAMRGCWNGNDRANWLPSIRNRRSQAKTTDITIPYRTYATRFLLLQPLDERFTALVLLWIRTFLWSLFDTLPDIAVFFTRRLMVLVLTRLDVSCSRRWTTFLISLGCCSR